MLVTGGSGRIGQTLCEAIVGAGGSVVNLDIAAPSNQAKEKIPDASRYLYVPGSAVSPTEVCHAIDQTLLRFGSFDAAVHCAYPTSSQWGTSFEELKAPELMEDVSQQLGGAILFSQQVLSNFCKQGWGKLIHVSSIQGVRPPKFWHYQGVGMTSPVEYSAIKAGVIAITKYLAKLYMGQGLQINCISPGGIQDSQPNEFLNRYQSSCNSKGMLDANDIVGLFLFLLSDEGKYISGQNIIIDDGWSL